MTFFYKVILNCSKKQPYKLKYASIVFCFNIIKLVDKNSSILANSKCKTTKVNLKRSANKKESGLKDLK